MPIAPVFPKGTTGGNPAPWLPLSLNGWMESDPAGLVDTITEISPGVYEVVENTVSASADLVYSSTTYAAYRAYLPLLDSTGAAISCDDQVNIDVQIKRLTPSAALANGIAALGIAVDPTSTTYTAILASGIGFHQAAAGTINGFIHDGAGGAFLTGASIVATFGSVSLGGGSQSVTQGTAYGATGVRIGNPTSRNYNGTAIGGSTPLYLWLEYSKRTASDAGVAGATLRFQAQYRISAPEPLI